MRSVYDHFVLACRFADSLGGLGASVIWKKEICTTFGAFQATSECCSEYRTFPLLGRRRRTSPPLVFSDPTITMRWKISLT